MPPAPCTFSERPTSRTRPLCLHSPHPRWKRLLTPAYSTHIPRTATVHTPYTRRKQQNRSDSPWGWLPPPRFPGPCTTLPAPRLCLRHASTSRLRRTCVVDSLTHAQRSILPASAPVLSLRRLSLRRPHAAPHTEPHAFAPCGCTCSYAPPRCATLVRRCTLIDRCAHNEAVHDPRSAAPRGNRCLPCAALVCRSRGHGEAFGGALCCAA